MNQDAKKTALRMIPYGIYVLTADDGKGNVAGATVNWVTQTAFNPPLVVAGVKTDSGNTTETTHADLPRRASLSSSKPTAAVRR